LPDWHGRSLNAGIRAIVINPSRLEISGQVPRGGSAHRDDALIRGVLVHRLLETLPGLAPASREKSGRLFLDKEGAALAPAERDGLLASVLRILGGDDFGDLFGPESRAEAPLAAELPPLWPGGPPLLIAGQMDRLVVRGDEALILDFKSGSAVPATPQDTPEAYLAQLAAYRLAISRLFPGKPVRAALLWTQAPRLMPISADLIDQGEWLLYESVRARHLD
jgi:ATP-dependent helicase/nuclease subunit A